MMGYPDPRAMGSISEQMNGINAFYNYGDEELGVEAKVGEMIADSEYQHKHGLFKILAKPSTIGLGS